jgi:8-hydroxy-5-deazaflavin:NADPH oxidoreductase
MNKAEISNVDCSWDCLVETNGPSPWAPAIFPCTSLIRSPRIQGIAASSSSCPPRLPSWGRDAFRVGRALAGCLYRAGLEVTFGSRDPQKSEGLKQALRQFPKAQYTTVTDAVAWADIVLLCIPGQTDDVSIRHVADLLGGSGGVSGKVLIDVTNPLNAQGMLEWGRELSPTEVLQACLPDTAVFKAFNTCAWEHYAGAAQGAGISETGPLTMMFAGDVVKEKKCADIIRAVGFRPEYCGGIRYARNLEAVAELYIHASYGMGGAKKWGREWHLQVERAGHRRAEP